MKDGGPAFPNLRRPVDMNTSEAISEGGMSLRDWFAGQALQGYLIGREAYNVMNAAKLSYEAADAMLKARENTEENL
jgi:hypothetical protein